MLSVTADTNVYISALNFGGPPDAFLDLARAGEIRLSISREILEELVHVLRDKFGWGEETIRLTHARLLDFIALVEPTQRVYAVREDPTDNRILECSMAAGSQFLVTGDKHLLKLGRYGDAEIMNVSDFLKLQRRSAGEVAR